MAQFNHLLYQKYLFFFVHIKRTKNYFHCFNILFHKIQIYFYTLLRIVIVVLLCSSVKASIVVWIPNSIWHLFKNNNSMIQLDTSEQSKMRTQNQVAASYLYFFLYIYINVFGGNKILPH